MERVIAGNKEFRYTNEDLARIRSTDTESTKKFKIALKKFYKAQEKARKAKEERIKIENNHNINVFTYPFYKLKWFLEAWRTKIKYGTNNFIRSTDGN